MIGQTFSHYKVLEKIGEGGMGQVYLAEDTSLERKVALKFLPVGLQTDPVAHKRFIREAKSAAAIEHPYICNIKEVSQTEDGQENRDDRDDDEHLDQSEAMGSRNTASAHILLRSALCGAHTGRQAGGLATQRDGWAGYRGCPSLVLDAEEGQEVSGACQF